MSRRPLKTLIAAALLCGLALTGAPARAEEFELDPYRLIDGTSLWTFYEGRWQRLRLAYVDGPKYSARRQPTERLSLPLDYLEIRRRWVAWIRQVGTFSETATQTSQTLLDNAKKRRWEKAHQEPARSSEVHSGTLWVRVEIDGEDLGQMLVKRGWAIPWMPPGVEEPDEWEHLLEEMQQAMSDCAGMWNDLLLQCAPEEAAPK